MMARQTIGTGLAAAGAVMFLWAGAARAQKLHGVAEVQYQKLSRVLPADDVEWWLTSVQLDFSTRFRKTLEFSSQMQFSEQKYIGRPDRQRTPRGTFRLAHPLFGLFGSYRPLLVTDSRNVTTERQELSLSGYAQMEGLPRIAASWTRNHQDPSGLVPGTVAVRRSLTANYDLGPLNLHAGYGDQTRENLVTGGRRGSEDNLNAGSSTRFEGRRASLLLQYDYNQARRRFGGASNRTTRAHTGGVNGGLQLSRKTSASLGYSFRQVGAERPGAPSLLEQDGTLNLSHRPFRAIQMSAGGGVRSADVGDRKEAESFVVGSLSADGEARPGWRLGASASHSLNWLPGERARPLDSFRSTTRMRLADGLEATGDLSLSKTTRPELAADTASSAAQVMLQSGAGLRATPLRRVVVNSNLRRYRTGSSLRGEGRISTSYLTSLDWKASSTVQLSGSWERATSTIPNIPDRTTIQTNGQWNPTRSLQVNASYTRTDQVVRDPFSALTAGREVYAGWIAAALTRELRTTIRYSVVDPGVPTRARQLSATLTQGLWR